MLGRGLERRTWGVGEVRMERRGVGRWKQGLGEQFQGRAETAPLKAADPSKGRRPQPGLLLLSLLTPLVGTT